MQLFIQAIYGRSDCNNLMELLFEAIGSYRLTDSDGFTIDGQPDEWMGGWIDEQMDRWMDG